MGETTPSSSFGIRRWFHHNERRLIIVWLALLLVLNLLPFAWWLANRSWGLEEQLVRGYRDHWVERVRKAEMLGKESPETERAELEALLDDLGPQQLRSAVGRLRQEVLVRLVRLRLEQGDKKGSEAAAREMSEIDDRDYRGWVGLGKALWAQGLRLEAIEADAAALAINPNIEPAVARLAAYHVSKGNPEAALEAFTEYKEALWATRVYLNFTSTWPRIPVSNGISLPAEVNGERQVLRMYPAGLRGAGALRFRGMEQIDGLRLVVADEAPLAVDVGQLRLIPSGEVFAPQPAPILEVRPSEDWRPADMVGDTIPGVWMPTESWKGWAGPVKIENPGEVGLIELEIALTKPVSLRLARAVGAALEELGRTDGENELTSGMRILSTAVSVAVAGHIRAANDDDPPMMPALVEKLPQIDARSHALVLTGDVVWEGTESRWDRFDELIGGPAKIPVWIAPGNHDLHDGRPGAARSRMVERYGPTWFSHRMGTTLVLVLDTEETPGDIREDQLEFAVHEVERAIADPSIEHVLVCLHRVLWFLGDDSFATVAERANASSRPGAGNAGQFMARLMPRLEDFARNRMVVMVAGDVGTRIPLVYHRQGRLIRIASGNRAQAPPAWWNHLLKIRFYRGDATIRAVQLGEHRLGRVERFTVDFWEDHPGVLDPPEGDAQ